MQPALASRARRVITFVFLSAVVATTLTAPFVMTGCASVPPRTEASRDELIQKDRALGVGVAQRFESQLKFRKDPEIVVYLGNIGTQLTRSTPELDGSSIAVHVVQDRDQVWRNYSVPGHRVYLSRGWVQGTEYENELAAMIAVELAHIQKRHLARRIDLIAPRDRQEVDAAAILGEVAYFGPNGAFAFTDADEVEAFETAVGILYAAGYDARGLASLCQRYRSNLEHSPFDEGMLDRIMEATRTQIANLAPLRNPIVRSQAFLMIKKRIERL